MIRMDSVQRDESRELGPFDYVELTYEYLRVGPDGDFIGDYDFCLGFWTLNSDSSEWSDITVYSAGM